MADTGSAHGNAIGARFSGFRLFLLASCLLAAAVGWLARSSLLEGLIVVAVLLTAMLLLAYHAARTSSPAGTTAGLPATADTTASRQPRRPQSRRHRRTELRLDAVDTKLQQHERTLRTVAEATRQSQIDLTNRLGQLEQRLTDLQNTTRQQHIALQQTRQHHMRRLHQTLAQLAATLDQDTTPTSHDG